jgi:hypothetical protein
MQYKISPIGSVWRPTNGSLIKLWKCNLDGSPKLPIGVPSLVPYYPIWGNDMSMEKRKVIKAGVFIYVEFWKCSIDQNATYVLKMTLYVEYWGDILLHLSKSLPLQSSTFLECFWSSNNWRFNYAKVALPTRIEVADAKDPIMCPYCGRNNLKPFPLYTPFRDLNNGNFVMVRPHDPLLVHVWMGLTQCDVVKDE